MFKQALDWQSPDVVSIYDDVSLWSAPFAQLLLENVPMGSDWKVLDIGFGTGFPLIELAQRFGKNSQFVGVDIWTTAIAKTRRRIEILELDNVEIIEESIHNTNLPKGAFELVCSNLGVNNFGGRIELFKKVVNCLKPGGHFCITTNDQRTFQELYPLFEHVFRELGIDGQALHDYIYSRPDITPLIKEIENVDLKLTRHLEGKSSIRFSSGEALFNHGFFRIAFVPSWKQLFPEKQWQRTLSLMQKLINQEIKAKGEFALSLPTHYLEFRKAADSH